MLQRYLRRLSDEYISILPVPIDGIFDTQTEAALIAFQTVFALPATGRADRATWDTLFEEYSRLGREEDRRVFPDFFPRTPEDYVTRLGEDHAFITLLRFMLNELRIAYDTIPPVSSTGVYNDELVRAVAEFQRISGIEQTGQVDRNTWSRLSEEYNNYAT